MKRKAVSQVADNSIELEVSLPSGRRETVAVSQSGTVADLKIAAQESLGQPFLRLATTAEGRLLDPTETLRFSELQDGGSLTAIAQEPKIVAQEQAGVRGGKTWVWVWVSTKYPFGNLRWQQKIMAKKLNEVLHENPI